MIAWDEGRIRERGSGTAACAARAADVRTGHSESGHGDNLNAVIVICPTVRDQVV